MTKQQFLEAQKERESYPICKYCGQHTEKFRITQKKGNTCQRCSKHKNGMKVKMWYYHKKGYTELYKKMLSQYNSLYVKKVKQEM